MYLVHKAVPIQSAPKTQVFILSCFFSLPTWPLVPRPKALYAVLLPRQLRQLQAPDSACRVSSFLGATVWRIIKIKEVNAKQLAKHENRFYWDTADFVGSIVSAEPI